MRRNIIRPWLISVLWILGLLLAGCSSKANPAVDQARLLVVEQIEKSHLAGYAITVAKDGVNIWSEGFGFADLEQMVRIDPAHSRFRIGSLSKPMTAVAVALLVEEGKLDLDAPVQMYVPSFPKKQGVVTTRLLGGHLAGIRHYKGDENFSSRQYATVIEGLNIFKDDSLLHLPGSKYQYSSYGWNLISAVVENAAGEPFLPFMEKYVFDALDMTRTGPDHIQDIIAFRTRYYSWNEDHFINEPFVDNSYKWAGGGFLATTEDLIKLGEAHIEPGFLTLKSLMMLHTTQNTISGEETGYGFGWRVGTDDDGHRWFGHGGGSVGGTSYLLIYPDERLVIAMAANMSGGRYEGLPQRIAAEFLKEE